MKVFSLSLIVLLCTQLTEASPRKVRPLEFPNNEEQAPRTDATLENDAVGQEQKEANKAIREESDEGPKLTERPRSETFTEYQARLEKARENLKRNPNIDKELKEKQMEALYEAEYQLRRDTFGGSESTGLYGHGAGPTGDRYNAPLYLDRVVKFAKGEEKLFEESKPEAEDSEAEETDEQREEGEVTQE